MFLSHRLTKGAAIETLPPIADDLQVIHYPHPTLRRASLDLKRVDRELVRVVDRMFELMYETCGIGLAANQVGLPLRLFVINLAGKRGEGEELVFINPVISRPKGTATAEEGCLSLPGVYGEVVRPKQVTVDAYDLQGRQFQGEIDGLLARCVQHELDHLDGVLFIDRLTESGKQSVVGELEEFLIDFDSRRKTGSIPDDAQLDRYCQDLERRYCGRT